MKKQAVLSLLLVLMLLCTLGCAGRKSASPPDAALVIDEPAEETAEDLSIPELGSKPEPEAAAEAAESRPASVAEEPAAEAAEVAAEAEPVTESVAEEPAAPQAEPEPEPTQRPTPVAKTCLTPDGFSVSLDEYREHLLGYLPLSYDIVDDDFYPCKIVSSDGEINISWNANDPASYKDTVVFFASESGEYAMLKDIMPEIVTSIDPELTGSDFDKAISQIRAYIDSRPTEFQVVLLHTGLCVVYQGTYALQVLFATVKYVMS